MALARRSNARVDGSIWPGFVDAMTALLLILFFVLSIFMIVQFALRDTIQGQGRELDNLSTQLLELSNALGLEQGKTRSLEGEIGNLRASLSDAEAQISSQLATILELTDRTNAQTAEISAFEQQVAALLLQNEEITAQAASDADAARLRAEALQAMIDDLELSSAEIQANLDESEQQRLAEIAISETLRERLQGAETELSALTLALEAKRKEAEDTLTLLAAANAAKDALETSQVEALSEIDQQKLLLAQANQLLSEEEALTAEEQRRVALLTAQTEELRAQLNELQGLLDLSARQDQEDQIQLELLGQNLNAALARVAQEQKLRAEAEARENELLEAEANDLRRYRSEFFGELRALLEGQEGVRIVGDRFVFSSEVSFAPGSDILGVRGQQEISKVAAIIRDIADRIPSQIDWVLRVDGHTDKIPVGVGRQFADNWELSQARALSVVRFLIAQEGLPPNRLAANGFGEFQPIDPADTPEAYALNRRIELKFTEK